MRVTSPRRSVKRTWKHTWMALKLASVVHVSNGDRCRSLGRGPDWFQNSPGWGCFPRVLGAKNRGGLVAPPKIMEILDHP